MIEKRDENKRFRNFRFVLRSDNCSGAALSNLKVEEDGENVWAVTLLGDLRFLDYFRDRSDGLSCYARGSFSSLRPRFAKELS